MKINRSRGISTLIACVIAFSANAADEMSGQQWQFDVALDGKPIGFHTFELQHDGSKQVLTTEASFDVRGELGDGSFDLLSAEGLMTLPRCVQTFAYWNPAILESQKLLNSQSGDYEDVSVTLEAREQVTVAGERVDALRYRLSAQSGDIILWYSSTDNTWIGLEAPAKGGRKILYQAVVVPDPDTSQQLVARRN